MPKTVEGYVLDRDSAGPIAGVPVTLYSAIDNHQITSTDAFGLSVNPATTDANGHFKITMDLSPGPVYVDAFIASTQHRRRYGLETMQLGDHWLSDIGTLMRVYSDGVVAGVTNGMVVSVSGVSNQFTVATGMALIQGYAWSLESGSFTKTIAPNTTQANRRSYVVLRQYTGGPQQGRQEIDIIYGASSTVDPVVKQNVTVGSDVIWEFPLWRLNTALNASVSTLVTDLRAYSNLGLTIYDGGVAVAGSVRGLDFLQGGSWFFTDEGGGIIGVNPSFGIGASDFKRGNAQTDGMRRGYINSSNTLTGFGNTGEYEVTHLDVALDPTVTYDVVIDGWLRAYDQNNTSTAIDIEIRCSMDAGAPGWASDAVPAGSIRVSQLNVPTGSGTATGNHQWTVRGVSGVSTIRTYLYIRPYAPSLTAVNRFGLSAKFFSRI